MSLMIPSWVFPLPKYLKDCYQFFERRNLEKQIEPLRAAACESPVRVAWTAKPGTETYQIFERMVKAKLMVRSPWFPYQYMLPTRWR